MKLSSTTLIALFLAVGAQAQMFEGANSVWAGGEAAPSGYLPPTLVSPKTIEVWPQCPEEKLRAAFTSALSDKVGVDLYLIEVEVLKACTRTRELLNELVAVETRLVQSYAGMVEKHLELETKKRAARSVNEVAQLETDDEVSEQAALPQAEDTSAAPEESLLEDVSLQPTPELALDAKNNCPQPRPLALIEWMGLSKGGDDAWTVTLRSVEQPSVFRDVAFGEEFLGAHVVSVDFDRDTVIGQDCEGVGPIREIRYDVHLPITQGTPSPAYETDPATGFRLFKGFEHE